MEQGWAIIEDEISKLINVIEGVPESPNYGTIYSTVYDMCQEKLVQGKDPNSGSKELYKRYKDVYVKYLVSKVLPCIREKTDGVSMLQEVVKRWENHKVMVSKLCRCFNYMDRYYILRWGLPSLKNVGFHCFYEIVYEEIQGTVRSAVFELFKGETSNNDIRKTFLLLKGVLLFFAEVDEPSYRKFLYLICSGEFALDRILLNSLVKELDVGYRKLHSSTEEKLLTKQVESRSLPAFFQQDHEKREKCIGMMKDISRLQMMQRWLFGQEKSYLNNLFELDDLRSYLLQARRGVPANKYSSHFLVFAGL